MNLIPYITFEGNCKDALNYYKEIFEGEIVYIQYFKDGPEMGLRSEQLTYVMHSELSVDGQSIYLYDSLEETISKSNRIGINLAFKDIKRQEKIFNKLSENGIITMPLKKQFWGDTFGSVIDRFGIPWSLNCNE